jgi:hypothetical protein
MLTEREITLCRVALLLAEPSDEKRALLIKLGEMRDAMANNDRRTTPQRTPEPNSPRS